MKKRRSTLIMVFEGAMAALILSVCSYFFLASNVDDLSEQNKQYLKEISQQNAHSIKGLVERDLDHLSQLARIIGNSEDFSTEKVVEALTFVQQTTIYKRLGFILPDGEAYTTDKNIAAFNASERLYFQNAIAGNTCVSDRLLDKVDNSNESINVYATPLYRGDVLEGVIIATNNTKVYAESLAIESFSGEGFSYIVKEDGSPVVFSENPNSEGEFDNLFDEIEKCGINPQELQEMKDNIAKGDMGVIEYSRNNVPRVAAYSKVGVNDWYVVSVVPTAVIYERTKRLIFRNIVAVVIVLVMALAFITLLACLNKKNRKKLEAMAYVDKLTGGNNYNKFLALSAEKLEKHRTEATYLVYVDIDNLRLINDMYGYKEGDSVLKAIERTLRSVMPKDGVCGRVANDNFVLLILCRGDKDILALDVLFRSAFKELLESEGKKYTVGFTTGVYKLLPEDTDISQIIDKAARAHHHAKKRQADKNIAFYTDKIRDDAVKVKAIEDVMDKALAAEEFLVYLQPKYFLKDESIGGVEALVRWKTTDGEIIYPNDFIPVFEQDGFVVKLDMYMLQNACRIISGWIEKGIKPVTVSVNFSRRHLSNSAFVSDLCKVVDSYSIERKWIEVELTENAIYDNYRVLMGITSQLHAAGFTISMDDFGSGYSSLGLLKDLPVDVIKIDRSFFVEQKSAQRSKTVVGSVIEMAKRLGIYTVAEGVEEQSNIDLLRELNCDMVQGYYYAKPMPTEEFTALLKAERDSRQQ